MRLAGLEPQKQGQGQGFARPTNTVPHPFGQVQATCESRPSVARDARSHCAQRRSVTLVLVPLLLGHSIFWLQHHPLRHVMQCTRDPPSNFVLTNGA